MIPAGGISRSNHENGFDTATTAPEESSTWVRTNDDDEQSTAKVTEPAVRSLGVRVATTAVQLGAGTELPA